jgi:hypothetical protein
MSEEPENFTLALLRKIDAKVDSLRDEVSGMREVMATKNDIADVRSGNPLATRRCGFGYADSGKAPERSDRRAAPLGDGISLLRDWPWRTLTELEERVRRLEQHAGLSPEGH